MKKNVGITDRIIRFVAIDLLLGLSFLGFEIPMEYATVAFITAVIIGLPMIFGYSLVYQLMGWSTREEALAEANKSQE
jgi:hypothetical protein